MRCVNIDWLEVYVLEDSQRYPCNADYFLEHGYNVDIREYGTRSYQEMFVIKDEFGEPFIEVRRNPFSGQSSFTGLNERSAHLRFVNRYCYFDDAIRILISFLLKHDYELQRIFRIDIAYDFRCFDYGDKPETFLRRYIEKKFSKVNQCKVRTVGDDGWSAFAWESISWGSPTSMVSTKIYNKTKELQSKSQSKWWIPQAWFQCGLIDDPLNLPDVWRIEFSLHSSIRNWLIIEDNDGRHEKKRKIPHTLALFDGRERLWQRFQDLAHHYFHFKYVESLKKVDSGKERELKRKDKCRDKLLFRWDKDREFYQIDNVSREVQPNTKDDVLRRHLSRYRESQYDGSVIRACDVILERLDRLKLANYTGRGTSEEVGRLIVAIRSRTGWDYNRAVNFAKEIQQLIKQGEIW